MMLIVGMGETDSRISLFCCCLLGFTTVIIWNQCYYLYKQIKELILHIIFIIHKDFHARYESNTVYLFPYLTFSADLSNVACFPKLKVNLKLNSQSPVHIRLSSSNLYPAQQEH